MHPIAIFQSTANDGPALFETFARARQLSLQLYRLYAQDPLPTDVQAFSGLCILGSPASVNDDQPAFKVIEKLIVQARAQRIPVIGHCFGGQILSKALGGSVSSAPHAEIGWSDIQSDRSDWFGDTRFPMFQWHFETFSIPPDAQLVATGSLCRHQAFTVDDIHLGMQFHCEVDLPKIEGWLDATGCAEIAASPSAGVQDPQRIRSLNPGNLQDSTRVAQTLYTRWARALRP